MSNAIFPPGTVAGHMSEIVQTGSLWRTFVHCSDNKIHQLVRGVNALDYQNNVVPGPTPMLNSPVAVICWGVKVLHTHIFYFTDELKVQVMSWNSDVAGYFETGPTLGDVMECSIALYAQVEAHGDTLTEIRVGYQSPSNPETITESYYTPSTGWRTRIYHNEM
ncbi:hypothetical protein K503DRAFT_60467 [Rhizopogon vinicolor AM-OR11-026]|uniref:Uncharacterized protein n=1 Tax=Rhizopogon vinicolor AM-OR11-026 TaxID=1314800 RepID=A0A1B7MGE6_9AGAM|nr:hypothetical protein K503DRAFT_60467 [Rhizopogon vinicolor AM-OR11-026]